MAVVEHPNDLDLELARTGEADAEVSAHLETCQVCRERSQLLERLASELAMETIDIPPEWEAAILAFADERAHARRAPARRRWLWAVPAVAAAAALLLVLPFAGEQPDRPPVLAAAPDINDDGDVNIVDAMLLARALKREQRDEWDANGDARVDDDDVEYIALAAVSLEGRGR